MYELQRLRRLHILLVDDDPGAFHRIQQALGSHFHLYHAQSLVQARQHLIEYIPDIVICEIKLGKDSGLELCRFIRNTPILRLFTQILEIPQHMLYPRSRFKQRNVLENE